MNGHIIPGTPLAVDFFQIRKCPNVKLFFLTHLHGDHTVGLTSSWQRPIYCSPLTGQMLVDFYGIKEGLVRTLEVNETHIVTVDKEMIAVTVLDANHCPGSVMFIFDGQFGKILHTGDFRYHENMINDSNKNLFENIETVYLDNTYCDQHCTFPKRDKVISSIVSFITSHPNHAIVIGMRNLGKEDLLISIAKECNEWISLPADMFNRMTFLNPEVSAHSVCDDDRCRIRVVKFHEVSNRNAEKWNKVMPTHAILPTAMFKGIDLDPFCNIKNVHVFPYSDHSSYTELVEFIEKVKPQRIVPIVAAKARGPYGSDIRTRADMLCFSHLLARKWTEPQNCYRSPKETVHSKWTSREETSLPEKQIMFRRKKPARSRSVKKNQPQRGVIFEDDNHFTEEDSLSQKHDFTKHKEHISDADSNHRSEGTLICGASNLSESDSNIKVNVELTPVASASVDETVVQKTSATLGNSKDNINKRTGFEKEFVNFLQSNYNYVSANQGDTPVPVAHANIANNDTFYKSEINVNEFEELCAEKFEYVTNFERKTKGILEKTVFKSDRRKSEESFEKEIKLCLVKQKNEHTCLFVHNKKSMQTFSQVSHSVPNNLSIQRKFASEPKSIQSNKLVQLKSTPKSESVSSKQLVLMTSTPESESESVSSTKLVQMTSSPESESVSSKQLDQMTSTPESESVSSQQLVQMTSTPESESVSSQQQVQMTSTPESEPVSSQQQVQMTSTPESEYVSSQQLVQMTSTPESESVSSQQLVQMTSTPESESVSSQQQVQMTSTPESESVSSQQQVQMTSTPESESVSSQQLVQMTSTPESESVSSKQLDQLTSTPESESVSSQQQVQMTSTPEFESVSNQQLVQITSTPESESVSSQQLVQMTSTPESESVSSQQLVQMTSTPESESVSSQQLVQMTSTPESESVSNQQLVQMTSTPESESVSSQQLLQATSTPESRHVPQLLGSSNFTENQTLGSSKTTQKDLLTEFSSPNILSKKLKRVSKISRLKCNNTKIKSCYILLEKMIPNDRNERLCKNHVNGSSPHKPASSVRTCNDSVFRDSSCNASSQSDTLMDIVTSENEQESPSGAHPRRNGLLQEQPKAVTSYVCSDRLFSVKPLENFCSNQLKTKLSSARNSRGFNVTSIQKNTKRRTAKKCNPFEWDCS